MQEAASGFGEAVDGGGDTVEITPLQVDEAVAAIWSFHMYLEPGATGTAGDAEAVSVLPWSRRDAVGIGVFIAG